MIPVTTAAQRTSGIATREFNENRRGRAGMGLSFLLLPLAGIFYSKGKDLNRESF
jgi:hypothetical protein